MSVHYDVIIVGGGYAGLCCGLKLALKGRRILILEARREIARKHRGCQCSLYPFGESFTLTGNDITFHHNNITVPNALMARLTTLECTSGNGKFKATPSDPLPIIDEGKVKGALENACRERGVDISTGTKVTSIETNGQRATVFADTKYEADYLVGADGAHSMVINCLPRRRKKIGTLVELDVETKRMDLPRNAFYADLRSSALGMYAQPYGEGYMLGVFQGLGKNSTRINLQQYLEESLDRLKAEGVTRRYACSIPIYPSAPSSSYKNILMAGDSVGSLSMVTITGAMLMGLLAGEAVSKQMEGDTGAFEEYDKKWRSALQQQSMDKVRFLFFLLKRLNEKRMPRFVKALEGPDLTSVGMWYFIKRIPAIVRAFL